MNYEFILTQTFLSKQKNALGKVIAFSFCALCIISSLIYWSFYGHGSRELVAYPNAVFELGEYWRLFTSLFLHANIEHLLSNMLMLFILTYFVVSFYGAIITLLFALTFGAITNIVVLTSFTTQTSIVGISGVIYYLWGFWLILYLLIDIKVSITQRLLNILAIFFILLIPTSYSPSTSYLAHYTGLLFGVMSGLIYYPFIKERVKKEQKYEIRFIPELEKSESEF